MYEELAKLSEPVPEIVISEKVPAELLHQAMHKALSLAPHRFFAHLRTQGALKGLFPEIDALFGVPQPPEHHPEIDTGVHTLMVLAMSERLSEKPDCRFAALTHDLGKARTSEAQWPSHHGHEALGIAPLTTLARRCSVPSSWYRSANLVVRYHTHCHRALQLRPATLLKLLKRTGGLSESKYFTNFTLACEADSRGRPGYTDQPYPQAQYLHDAAQLLRKQKPDKKSRGKSMQRKLRENQIRALQAYIKNRQNL